jgi:hypothetical protein
MIPMIKDTSDAHRNEMENKKDKNMANTSNNLTSMRAILNRRLDLEFLDHQNSYKDSL